MNPQYVNILNEDSLESINTDTSDTSQSVAELMAKLETEVGDLTEEGGSSEHQMTTASDFLSDKLPEETWKNMTSSQRKNFLKQRKKAKTCTTQSSTSKDERKRGREIQTTPSPSNTVKKPKLEYSVAAASIKVAVAHKDYPHHKIGDEHFQRLMLRLLKCIREIKPDQAPVGFNGYSLRDGALVVNCKDEPTKDWFVRSVMELSPWEGAPLRTCDPKELEGFRKMGAFFPSPVEGIKECLKNLQVQNAGLQTERWKVLGSKTHKHGMYLVASIPESIARIVEERSGRLYHGFHNIQVKMFSGKEVPKQEGIVEAATTGGAVGVSVAGAGVVASVPDVPYPLSTSCHSASGPVTPEPRRQRTEHKGRRDREAGRRVADASGPVVQEPNPGEGKEETPPCPKGDPSTS